MTDKKKKKNRNLLIFEFVGDPKKETLEGSRATAVNVTCS